MECVGELEDGGVESCEPGDMLRCESFGLYKMLTRRRDSAGR